MSRLTHISMDTNAYNCQISDISGSAKAVAVPMIAAGLIIDAWGSNSVAITTANAVVTVAVNPGGVVANAVTIGTITFVASGSGVGQAFQMVITGTEAQRFVNQGDVVTFTTDGGSTTASVGVFTLVVNDV